MLGITIPEAVGVATVILAIGAAWKGTRAGDAARGKATPPEAAVSIGATVFADSLMMQRLVDGLTRIADIMEDRQRAEDAREKDRIGRALEDLVSKLDTMDQSPVKKK
jgi:hypothetical protein